jgi:multidrug transporter EmrE-like cation transporter
VSKIIITLYILTTSAALVVLKLGSQNGALVSVVDGKLIFNINLVTLLGIFFFGASFTLYTYIISSYDLGYIIPLTASFVYILVFGASYFIFNESFNVLKIIAIALMIIGIILLNISNG